MQPWPLVSPLVPSTGEASEPEDCRRRILRIRRLGVRIPPGALCVETDDQALTSGNAGWGLARLSSLQPVPEPCGRIVGALVTPTGRNGPEPAPRQHPQRLGQRMRTDAHTCLLYTSPSPRDGLLS